MTCVRYAPWALLLFALTGPLKASWISPVISEFHYDNRGADVDEFVAVMGPGGLDLSGWELVLYNGSNGRPYGMVALSGVLGDFGGGLGEAYWLISGLQNDHEAIALVSPTADIVDFVAYEAGVSAVTGVASGASARVLPVAEGNSTETGTSLQRIGLPGDWIWISAPATPGIVNPGIEGLSGSAAVPAVNVGLLWLSACVAWLPFAVRRRNFAGATAGGLAGI